MMELKPITYANIQDFDGTEYEAMSREDREKLIEESLNRTHKGAYFEFLAVYEGDAVVGFMNLFAHSAHIISCGPEIKRCCQKKGVGFLAESMALEYAKKKGYTVAVGDVAENNAASIALHEKLGFELDRKYQNKQGRTVRIYIKAL
ncbi:MAG: GNAT family N-acetyltransferase [Clostridia bacterium]|nr:GNAT family N-acetyltransferase [Clostridia bacterium]